MNDPSPTQEVETWKVWRRVYGPENCGPWMLGEPGHPLCAKEGTESVELVPAAALQAEVEKREEVEGLAREVIDTHLPCVNGTGLSGSVAKLDQLLRDKGTEQGGESGGLYTDRIRGVAVEGDAGLLREALENARDWLRRYRAGEEIPVDRAHVVADEIDASLKLHRLSTQQQLEQSTTGPCPACNHPEGGHWDWCIEAVQVAQSVTGKKRGEQ